MTRRSVLVATTSALLLGAAHQASAATIATSRPCLNFRSPAQFVGTGFAPGSTVKVSGDFVTFENGVAGPDGSVAIPFEAPLGDVFLPPQPFNYSATDGTTTATGTSLIADPGLETVTFGRTRFPMRYQLSGFEPGLPIYAHVRWGERWRRTAKLGVAKGPCGTLDVKAKLLRKTAGRRGRSVYLQFDHLSKPVTSTHQLAFGRFRVSPGTAGNPEKYNRISRGYRERTGP